MLDILAVIVREFLEVLGVVRTKERPVPKEAALYRIRLAKYAFRGIRGEFEELAKELPRGKAERVLDIVRRWEWTLDIQLEKAEEEVAQLIEERKTAEDVEVREEG